MVQQYGHSNGCPGWATSSRRMTDYKFSLSSSAIDVAYEVCDWASSSASSPSFSMVSPLSSLAGITVLANVGASVLAGLEMTLFWSSMFVDACCPGTSKDEGGGVLGASEVTDKATKHKTIKSFFFF